MKVVLWIFDPLQLSEAGVRVLEAEHRRAICISSCTVAFHLHLVSRKCTGLWTQFDTVARSVYLQHYVMPFSYKLMKKAHVRWWIIVFGSSVLRQAAQLLPVASALPDKTRNTLIVKIVSGGWVTLAGAADNRERGRISLCLPGNFHT